MKSYERTHDNENISIVISSDATMAELCNGLDFIQAEINSRPSLVEPQAEPQAQSVQAGPVQVVEHDPAPEWSEWYDWSGGENPVPWCVVDCKMSGHTKNWVDSSYMFIWRHKGKTGDITHYRVQLYSIPEGCALSADGFLRGVPKAEWPEWAVEPPEGYVWAGFGRALNSVAGVSLIRQCESEGTFVRGSFAGVYDETLYALPIDAPAEHWERFAREGGAL